MAEQLKWFGLDDPMFSSNINGIAYDEIAKRCFVQFKNGSTYVYGDVDKPMWDGFVDTPSKGRYLNQSIKPYCSYERVVGA